MSGFSLDLDLPPAPPKTAADPVLDDFDLPDIDANGPLDPMLRKLELAEEFRQIGDKDGARELLREVLANASGVTQSKAQTMLDDLG